MGQSASASVVVGGGDEERMLAGSGGVVASTIIVVKMKVIWCLREVFVVLKRCKGIRAWCSGWFYFLMRSVSVGNPKP